MKLKSIAERLTGGAVEAPPAVETAEERAEAAVRLKRLLDAAATESGNRVRDLHEWQGIRHVLTSVRLKARLARGMPEARARREIDIELDTLEDEIGRLVADSHEFEQQQTAERAREQAAEFVRLAAAMSEITAEMIQSPELGRLIEWLSPLHAQASAIRGRLIELCGSDGARAIPDSRPYTGLRLWTPSELIAKAVAAYDERHPRKETS